MRVGVKSDPGQVRGTNEDRYGILPNLLAVADGMGGVQAGEVASQMVIDTLLVYPFAEGSAGELAAAVREANRRIFQAAGEKAEWQGMGTTITAVLFAGAECHVAQVGDSRAYLIRDGRIRRLTADHSLVGELLRNGSISPEEAMLHPHRNLLTRALGTAAEVEVDLTSLPLAFDDVLVLCTDGLTGLVTDEEILAETMRHADPQAAAEGLVALANARGGPDNVTVIVAHLLPPIAEVSPEAEMRAELEGLLVPEGVGLR
ncbi:MAG TPA: Stp1/IreP family PP2C-type Ser/Thr phosphatase [Firmicutes bacterium]|nr:Stp1/IreP family PP2C-type Ser/Thr phosphatase [Bacillota bacterium]